MPVSAGFNKIIESEDEKAIRQYLDSKASRQDIDDGLFWAAMRGCRSAIRILLEYGADVNRVDQFGSSVLHWAVQGNQFLVIDTILHAGADFSNWWTLESESLLHWASLNDCDFLVETLLELGADFKAVDSSGRMAIHTASLTGKCSALKSLLHLYPDKVDILDHNGWTPLHYACTSNAIDSQRVIHILMKANANPLLRTPGGRSSMDLAFEGRRVKAIFEVLNVHAIFSILIQIDDISHTSMGFADSQASCRTKGKPRRRDQMKTVKREYTFLQENFKRISKRRAEKINDCKKDLHATKSREQKPRTISDSKRSDSKFSKSRDYFSIWRKILLNDDAELLSLLRDSEKDGDGDKIFEECQCLDAQDLIELYYDCFENGLAILSYVRAHFHSEMMSGKFKEILSSLTRLDTFVHIDVGGCRVMTPLSSNILFICLLCGRLRVVELLLRMRQFDILPMCLLVTLIVRRWCINCGFAEQARTTLEQFADKIEMIAVDVLNQVYLKDNSEGKQTTVNFINMPFETYSNMSVVDLAAKASCTKFINHPCCQAVLTNLWKGKLHWLPNVWLWAGWFCPFMLPIYFEREMKNENNLLRSHIKRMDSKQQNPLTDDPDDHRKLFRSFEDLHQNRASTYFKIISYLFTAPSYKFFLYSFLYIVFLFTFSYITIYAFHFKASKYEIFCFVFLVAFAVEELRLLYFSIRSEQMAFYFKNYWNILSIVALCISFIGFFIRAFRLSNSRENAVAEASDIVLYISRVILLNGLMIFYLRLLFVFSLRARIGPKIRMISAMLTQDLLPVLFIFVIFFISFGVTFQGILYPNGFDFNEKSNTSNGLRKHSEFESVKNMIRLTFYGMMAAEYSIEDRDSNIYYCNSWDKDCVGPIGQTLFVYFFMILYVLIVNIMLVNLLIALYSNTVSQIDKESNALWLADRYNMVQEFMRRSIMPPPLSLICVLYDFVRYLSHACFAGNQSNTAKKKTKFVHNLDMEKVLINYMITQAFALSNRRYVSCRHSDEERKNKFTRLMDLEKSIDTFGDELNNLIERVDTFLREDKTLFNNRESCNSAIFMDASDTMDEYM